MDSVLLQHENNRSGSSGSRAVPDTRQYTPGSTSVSGASSDSQSRHWVEYRDVRAGRAHPHLGRHQPTGSGASPDPPWVAGPETNLPAVGGWRVEGVGWAGSHTNPSPPLLPARLTSPLSPLPSPAPTAAPPPLPSPPPTEDPSSPLSRPPGDGTPSPQWCRW